MSTDQAPNPHLAHLLNGYLDVRQQSLNLAASLSDADATVQSMEDASPAKWHLAHTTWFFETLVLSPENGADSVFDPAFALLFNSYYESFGVRYPRPRRGMLTQPSLNKILSYRAYVDEAMDKLLSSGVSATTEALVTLGMHP